MASIPKAIVTEQMPEYPHNPDEHQFLCFKSVIAVPHDTGGIYFYLVLVRLINHNRKLAAQLVKTANVDVIIYDLTRRPIVTSFSQPEVPYPQNDTLSYQGRSYNVILQDLTDFTGQKVGQLGVAHDNQHFLKLRKQLILWNLPPLFISIIIWFAVFFLLKTKVFEKISGMIAALRTVSSGEGDLSIRLPIPRKKIESGNLDEVDLMLVDFNHMMEKLESSYSQLIKARRQAEAASCAKSQFLANMSHEIRTPLNGVLGMTELLLQSELKTRQREFAKNAFHSGQALLDILNDTLDLSKIEAGKLELVEANFDLPELVEETVGLFAEQAHGKGLELACFISQDVPAALYGDAGRLRQIFINLISNGIKFTTQGEVIVTAQMVEQDDQAVFLRFDVNDTGIGIVSELQKIIFEPFTQADQSTSKKFGGTGLGLTIAHQLAHLMGGNIHVESEPRKGSNFCFTVRLKKQAITDRTKQADAASLASVRALVVNHHAATRSILLNYLESWGMTCLEAENGVQAIDLLRSSHCRSHPVDLAIVDEKLSDMTGLELATAIGSDDRMAGLKLILLQNVSGQYQNHQDHDNILYLYKPVRRTNLYYGIFQLLDLKLPEVPLEIRKKPEDLKSYPQLPPYHILLVEDNRVNQEVARAQLESLGCSVDSADNGNEAINLFLRGSYDLISDGLPDARNRRF